jgi:hypothetical protein
MVSFNGSTGKMIGLNDKTRRVYEQKKRARFQRKCKGHWINKGYGIRNDSCYEEGICVICGGLENENIK